MVDAERAEHDGYGEPTKEKGGRGAERPRAIRFRPTSLDKGSMQTIEDCNEGDCRAGEYEIGEKGGNGHDTLLSKDCR